MSISEQVKGLRYKADIYNTVGSVWELNRAEAKILQGLLRKAADTIESLSAKLQAANNNRSIKPNECVEVDEDGVYEGKCPCCGELVFNHFRFCPDCGQELLWGAKKYEYPKTADMEQSEDCGGWIPKYVPDPYHEP